MVALQTLTEIRQLLAERGIRPKHRLGQNFLHDKNQLAKLIEAAELRDGDLVLEVGPGTGTLTEALLERGAEVIACELDRDMAAIIHDRLRSNSKLTLIQGDALAKQRQLNPEIVRAIAERKFKLVANLPYQAASPLIAALLIDHPNCEGLFVTIQKEVADRLMAQPGTKQYGPLTVIVQAMAAVARIGVLSPSCFWPPPEVTSAMVAIVPRKREEGSSLSPAEASEFARFVTELFSKRRKQLGTIFGREEGRRWPEGVNAEQRPEALNVEQIIALWRTQAQRSS